MFESIYKGWNFFSKKIILLWGIIISGLIWFTTAFFQENITNFIQDVGSKGLITPIITYIPYLFSEYGWKFVGILGILFLIGFLVNWLAFTIALGQGNNKSQKNTNTVFRSIPKIMVYTFLTFIITSVFGFLGLLLLSWASIVSFILLIILMIFWIAVLLVIIFGIICMGLNNTTIKEGLNDAWTFIKNKFWLSVLFFIIFIIILYILFIILDSIFFAIFGFTEFEYITSIVLTILILLYSTNTIAFFTNKHLNKISTNKAVKHK
ncbi:MAG TPA: hypothetical protein P5513_01060 [Candidatus Diapherotrites archaeon]|nr:hypothetical protein [Candidatus Diapherotrites archaeon]